jgi:hypothetical protein
VAIAFWAKPYENMGNHAVLQNFFGKFGFSQKRGCGSLLLALEATSPEAQRCTEGALIGFERIWRRIKNRDIAGGARREFRAHLVLFCLYVV